MQRRFLNKEKMRLMQEGMRPGNVVQPKPEIDATFWFVVNRTN